MSPPRRARSAKGAVKKKAAKVAKARPRRTRVSQADVPAYPLDQALRVPIVLRDQYAKQPTEVLDVAKALNMSPSSGPFRMLTGAAVAYGLTTGGGQGSKPIGLTDLGKHAVAPTVDGDDVAAQRAAFLKPRVLHEFLTRYDGNPFPSKTVALNVLEDLGVPTGALEKTLDLIVSGGRALGLLDEISGKTYVRLGAAGSEVEIADSETGAAQDAEQAESIEPAPSVPSTTTPGVGAIAEQNDRVFITHGSNLKIVEQLKEVLSFGKFTPVVSIEREAVAKPVPDKVLDDMSSCGAAIIHVGSEQRLLDDKGKEHVILNPNVLIEIGAAMMRFRRRFILLVEKGVKLPSNLQGLYEVRYEGDELDYPATMKLLRAFNEFREE